MYYVDSDNTIFIGYFVDSRRQRGRFSVRSVPAGDRQRCPPRRCSWGL